MLQGFRDVVMRGNIIELGIAVVIGVAFTALVATITEALIQPLINIFLGGGVSGAPSPCAGRSSTSVPCSTRQSPS